MSEKGETSVMTSEMFADMTVEEARRRAGEIMSQSIQYTPSSIAELHECVVLVAAGFVTRIEWIEFDGLSLIDS